MNSNIEIEQYNFGNNTYDRISIENTLNNADLSEIAHTVAKKNVRYISFDYEQTVETWKEINRIIKSSNSAIRITLMYRETKLENLSFLEYLTDVEELFVFYFQGTDLSPIAYLKKLKVLKFFNAFQSAKVRLKPLTSLTKLEELKIFHIKDIEEIEKLKTLKYLGLESIKVDNLNFLKSLINLEKIELRSCDRVTDYSGLYDLPKLKEAFILKNYKDTTAEFISHLVHLEKLDITDFNSVSKFPSLEKLVNLKDLSITNWKKLNDISGVAKAKNLVEFSAFVGKEFKPEALKVLIGHDNLKTLRAGFYNAKQEAEFEIIKKEILG